MKEKTSERTESSELRVALVHDFLREYGGAERVLEALHALYPSAPVFVAFADKQTMGIHWQRFAKWDLRLTWMARIPFHQKFFSPLRIFAPTAFRSLDLSKYDVVISSSNAYFAKSVRVRDGAVHLCYCHTPPRALYGYSTMIDWKKHPIINFFGGIMNHFCRIMDAQSVAGVTQFLANSQEVQQRIAKFYRRQAVIVHPPVQVPPVSDVTKKAARVSADQRYFLYVNRLAYAKHPELAVQVATELNLPLKVVGSGKILPVLQQMAGPTVEFLGAVEDEQLHTLYAGAHALLYPVEDEDFGIVPVEAMGHGVPVIAHWSGGPRETIVGLHEQVDRQVATGIFFKELSSGGLRVAVEDFLHHEAEFDRKKIALYAQQFASEEFARAIERQVRLALAKAVRSAPSVSAPQN